MTDVPQSLRLIACDGLAHRLKKHAGKSSVFWASRVTYRFSWKKSKKTAAYMQFLPTVVQITLAWLLASSTFFEFSFASSFMNRCVTPTYT
jgi:hypothetical protein